MPNNIILRHLWIALSLLVGAIVATVGCATYIVTWLVIDVEYDIKYMEVEIEVLGLSPAEAHEYIKKKEQEFNRLGASQFSTLSAKRGRKIEKSLKYLYNIYPAPPVVEDDTKHNEVIDKISDVEQGLSVVAEDTKSLVNDIAINKENQIERDKINDDARARFNEMVKQRDNAAKEQTYSPAPKHFEPKLSLDQVQIIVEYMNDLKLFKVVVLTTRQKIKHPTPIA
ncbi:MAG: hypothetical protein SNH27_18070 [Rikenellaceae bacterium]